MFTRDMDERPAIVGIYLRTRGISIHTIYTILNLGTLLCLRSTLGLPHSYCSLSCVFLNGVIGRGQMMIMHQERGEPDGSSYLLELPLVSLVAATT